MPESLSDLVDLVKLREILEIHQSTMNLPIGITDQEGNEIISIGWRDICVNFHRSHPETINHCKCYKQLVNEYVRVHGHENEDFPWFKCENGLIDAVAPIIIEGKHIANIFVGQFLFEPPDLNCFEGQARKYGFPVADYMTALEAVPVLTIDYLNKTMKYLRTLVEILAQAGQTISKGKHFEEEIHRLDCLNLVGEMAASIGHEIRNPMTSVRGFIQLLKNKRILPEYESHFELMISEIDRANSIVTEFLSLTKQTNFRMKNSNLNNIILTLKPLIEANVRLLEQELVLDLGQVPEIYVDERKIKQLILNLVRNGLESMDKNGRLTLKTFTEGEEVILAVQDEGTGIPEAISSKIGSPFFTTKDNGTGLGLTVCYAIAKNHAAKLTFTTAITGTTFYVKFNSCSK